jgi:hypothetical protein
MNWTCWSLVACAEAARPIAMVAATATGEKIERTLLGLRVAGIASLDVIEQFVDRLARHASNVWGYRL